MKHITLFFLLAISYPLLSKTVSTPFGINLHLHYDFLRNLKIQCNQENGESQQQSKLDDIQAVVIGTCLSQGKITIDTVIPTFNFQSTLHDIMEESIKLAPELGLAADEKTFKLPLISSVKVDIKEKQFSLYASVKYGLRLNLGVWGSLDYTDDEQLKIKITGAKLGFVNIYRPLFFALERLNIKRFEARRPYITVDLAL
jgi:hypothetical protein